MSARSLSVVFLATLGLSLGWASTARADADSDAQDLFVRGRALRAQRECGAAVDLFRKAAALAPQRLGSLRNLAECEEELGRFASARRAWLELGRGLLVTKERAKYEGWDTDARENAARLQPRVAVLKIDVTVTRPEGQGPAQPADAVSVTLNGEPMAFALLGTPLERDPGKYLVVARAARGQAPVQQVLALAAGESKDVKLRLQLRPPRPEVRYEERTSTRRVAGWITAGVGAASLVAATVSFLVRQGALSDLAAACPAYETGPCPTSTGSILSRGSTAATMTTVFAIAGGVLVPGGLALVLASPDERVPITGARPPRERAPRLAASPTLGGAQLTWRFQ